MLDLNTCQFVVMGYTHMGSYHTHGHTHEGWFRALQWLYGREVYWTDQAEEHCKELLSRPQTLIITNHELIRYIPTIRDDCFYVVHGGNDYQEIRERFTGSNNYLSWNVYHDCSHNMAPGGAGPIPGAVDKSAGYLLDVDFPFYPQERRVDFRWATDLLPPEIEANKPDRILNAGNNVFYVGSRWFVNEKELDQFASACRDNGVGFYLRGASKDKCISIQENVRLVRASCMAPSIVGSHHITEGYAPCRIFKSISYGQPGITNSQRVQDLFDGRLIYDPDCYNLFHTARNALERFPLKELHSLMDLVKEKHTYVSRLENLFKAVRLVQEL